MTEELKRLLDREYKKLCNIFESIKFNNCSKDIEKLVLSYWKDCKYFYSTGKILEAFELCCYIWGMLDILANMKKINVKEEYKKWFKAEF